MATSIAQLERALAYRFKNATLAQLALTHRSASRQNNERLEFLGDAIIGLLIAEELCSRFPEAPEGELSRMRARLVNQQTLAAIAQRLKIGEQLILGPGELKSGGGQRASILADAMEALLGAIYIDGGLSACRDCTLLLFAGEFLTQPAEELRKDAKTALQELLQSRSLPVPEYEVVAVEGTDHEQNFVVQCRTSLTPQPMTGTGRSRRLAEQDAAGRVLQALS
jgi:ribonuclease-3